MNTLKRNLILSAVAALLLTVAAPSTSLAQGRGHGRGHENGNNGNNGNSTNRDHDRDWSNQNWRRNSNYNRKCGKFVNCHDARNGRFDGRGPRGSRVGNNVWLNRRRVRAYNNTYWRDRNRRYYRRVYSNR